MRHYLKDVRWSGREREREIWWMFPFWWKICTKSLTKLFLLFSFKKLQIITETTQNDLRWWWCERKEFDNDQHGSKWSQWSPWETIIVTAAPKKTLLPIILKRTERNRRSFERVESVLWPDDQEISTSINRICSIWISHHVNHPRQRTVIMITVWLCNTQLLTLFLLWKMTWKEEHKKQQNDLNSSRLSNQMNIYIFNILNHNKHSLCIVYITTN